MALQTIPGFNGFIATKVSSMDNRAIGKFTDSNHLSSIHSECPSDYDKKIISLYTQTSLYSNDFLNMINNTTPFYLDGNSDYWKWKVSVPYMFPTIVEIPASTQGDATPGIDGKEFELVLSEKAFVSGDIVTSHRMFAPNFYVVKDPVPYGSGFLYTFTLVSNDPMNEYVSSDWLRVGLELEQIDHNVGEFDTELSGLDKLGQTIELYETLSASYGVEHTITDWADARQLQYKDGKPLDLVVYAHVRRNELGKMETLGSPRWEPFVEAQARQKMLSLKVNRAIWGKRGVVKSGGSRQEVKRTAQGIYEQMKLHGQYATYNRGEFSVAYLRDIFGDLFYRRVGIKDRRVKIYTNEAGFATFRKAAKEDLFNQGMTLVADERFIEGSGQNMVVNYAFEGLVTMETGKISLIHLSELDLPNTNAEFGQNKKSTPIFMVFDVSPEGDGTFGANVREVRHRSRPSMTWGYVDGAIHHLGFAKSQGMSSANKNPWYTLWFKDRSDIFVEDPSRVVLIEEIPQF